MRDLYVPAECPIAFVAGGLARNDIDDLRNRRFTPYAAESWNLGEWALLLAGSLAGIATIVLLAKRIGLIEGRASLVGPGT